MNIDFDKLNCKLDEKDGNKYCAEIINDNSVSSKS